MKGLFWTSLAWKHGSLIILFVQGEFKVYGACQELLAVIGIRLFLTFRLYGAARDFQKVLGMLILANFLQINPI